MANDDDPEAPWLSPHDAFPRYAAGDPLERSRLAAGVGADSLRSQLTRALDALREELRPRLPRLAFFRDAAPPEPTPPAGGEAPASDVEELTWVAIRLLDENGQPMADTRYRVTLPDGSRREGQLDQEGKARFDGIEEGSCRIVFPDLRRRAGA
jgi:hypothetical protein